jgi:hypothetical protein
MTLKRVAILQKTHDQVLKEYRHRCAKCGGDNPQIHHIDENPANNDPMNLIPLCPNCHLTDQHDPTRAIDPKELGLFRQYRNPMILKPQFHPLFARLKWLDEIREDSDEFELQGRAIELVNFVAGLVMGNFYGKEIAALVFFRSELTYHIGLDFTDAIRVKSPEELLKHAEEYRGQLRAVHDRVYQLAIELLRFQNW